MLGTTPRIQRPERWIRDIMISWWITITKKSGVRLRGIRTQMIGFFGPGCGSVTWSSRGVEFSIWKEYFVSCSFCFAQSWRRLNYMSLNFDVNTNLIVEMYHAQWSPQALPHCALKSLPRYHQSHNAPTVNTNPFLGLAYASMQYWAIVPRDTAIRSTDRWSYLMQGSDMLDKRGSRLPVSQLVFAFT